AFGSTSSAFSVVILGLAVNWFSAGSLAFTIFFYAVVYTMWSKRSTPQNIVIGGAAGAFPPMLGWACVTGGVSLDSIISFLIIFLWTPAHFWASASFKMRDYGSVGIPMMPVVAGEKATRRQISAYAVFSSPSTSVPWFIGGTGSVYGSSASVLGSVFVALSVRVGSRTSVPDDGMKPEKRSFGYS
ncbi:hypothetical protein OY671_010020, partial [Metschnikowia pulcherrima]